MWRAETRITEVSIRPPTGNDEEWLAARLGGLPIPLAAGLLARCVVDIGGVAPNRDDIEALTVGDREALLWHLRRLAFGDRIDAVVECGSCGEKLDMPLRIGELLDASHDPSYEDWAETFTDVIGGASVAYRLPTGRDQATAAEGEDLVASCLVEVDGDPPREKIAHLVGPVGDLMAQRDPQAEARLETECPSCGADVEAILDAFSFLQEEMMRRSVHLMREVHTLAWHYHWSEHDILAMTADRRGTYLDLIAETYEGSAS